MADTVSGANDLRRGFTTGEMIAGGFLLLLAVGLLLVGADMATGGRLSGLKRGGCGCQDETPS
jgi:hypothetical protein